MKQKNDIQEFWIKKEKEKNSKLVIVTACEYLHGYNDVTGPIYGLLYLMENGFYFENFENNSFMNSLFQGNKKFEKVNFNINLNEINEVKNAYGQKRKEKLTFINKIINFFSISSNIFIIKIKNNDEVFFKCFDPPLNICEKYYQLIK